MASRQIKALGAKYNISYEIIGDGADIVFLHGWGAKKEIMKKAFGAHLDGYRLIFIDLPGFGASSINKPLNTRSYAKIIKAFLDDIKAKPLCIAGHSFGGKIGALLNPPFLVLLSSAGIINKKPFLTRLKIAIFKCFKALGFGRFYRLFASKDVAGMSQTMYETLKNVVNENYESVFKACKSKGMIFWGQDDKTTPLKNGEKIAKLMPNTLDFIPFSGDHFFFLAHGDKIAHIIKSYLQNQCCNEMLERLDDENLNKIDEMLASTDNLNKEGLK